jgi:hypothetical protein
MEDAFCQNNCSTLDRSAEGMHVHMYVCMYVHDIISDPFMACLQHLCLPRPGAYFP